MFYNAIIKLSSAQGSRLRLIGKVSEGRKELTGGRRVGEDTQSKPQFVRNVSEDTQSNPQVAEASARGSIRRRKSFVTSARALVVRKIALKQERAGLSSALSQLKR